MEQWDYTEQIGHGIKLAVPNCTGFWCRNLFPSDEIVSTTVYTYLVPMKYGSQ